MNFFKIVILIIIIGSLSKALQAIDDEITDSPGSRWGHVFVYNPSEDHVLLFGGARKRGSYLEDTWTWDGSEWKYHDVRGPESRGFAAATYHAGRQTIILHGGRGNSRTTYSDTWEWNGKEWTLIDSAGPFHADHHQIVFLPTDSTILAFGGWTESGVSNETWLWKDGWIQSPQSGPPGRAAFAMIYDSYFDRAFLYGGLWIDGQFADMWEWKNGSWNSLSGPYDHSSLDHLSMVYNRLNNQIIGFGGKNYRRVLQSKTLSITDTLITILSKEGPSARHSVGMTFDSRKNQVLLYGGKEYQGEEQLPLEDFWIWDEGKWVIQH